MTNKAAERLHSVAGECFRAAHWQEAKRTAGAYVASMSADLEALAAAPAAEIDGALQLISSAAGCRDLGRHIKKQINEARKRHSGDARAAGGPLVSLASLLPREAPGALDRLVMPAGYVMTREGVAGPPQRDTDERPIIAARPVYLVGTVRSVSDGEYHADVAWQTPDRRWVVDTFPRHVLADSRALVKLSRRGLPVDSGTAAGLVRYLSAFERANTGGPVQMASDVLGWQGEKGAHGFMWGDTCIGGRGAVRLLAETGKAQIARAFTRCGRLDDWTAQVWAPIQAHPRVVLGVYASIAPVVMGIIESAPGFVVDFAGRSTGGKTTTLRVAASVWGDPARLIKSWSATANAIEHLASFSAFLPTFLDDTKEARNAPQRVIGAVYQITGTQSKLRASPDGLRMTSAFRTVLLSTGEAPITSFGADTGAAARVLSVRGFVFSDGDSRALADTLNAATLQQYGTLGPLVVSWLDGNRDQWPQIAQNWATLRERFAARSQSAFGGRSAPYVASLYTAAQLCKAAAGLQVNAEALAQVQRFAEDSAKTAERHRGALFDLWGWLASRPDAADSAETRGREVVVRWSNNLPSVIAVALRRWLDREGYQDDVIDEWARLGWIDTTGGRRTQVVRFHSSGQRVRCYSFTEAALEVAQGGAGE